MENKARELGSRGVESERGLRVQRKKTGRRRPIVSFFFRFSYVFPGPFI